MEPELRGISQGMGEGIGAGIAKNLPVKWLVGAAIIVVLAAFGLVQMFRK